MNIVRRGLGSCVGCCNSGINFAKVNAQQSEETVRPFLPFAELVYFLAALFGLIWSFNVEVTETHGVNYFPIKATFAQVSVNILSVLSLIISFTSVMVTAFGGATDKIFDTLVGRNPAFKNQYLQYVATFRVHIFTHMFLSLFYALTFEHDTYDEHNAGILALGWLSFGASVAARLINEIRHGQDLSEGDDITLPVPYTGKGVILGKAYSGEGMKLSRVPAIVLLTGLIIYRGTSDDGLFDGTHWAHTSTSALLLAILLLLIAYVFILKNDQEAHISQSLTYVMVATLITLFFTVAALSSMKSEAAVITLLAVYILDYMRVGYIVPKVESREDEKSIRGYAAMGYRFAHFLVGVAGAVLLYLGVEETEGWGFDKLNGTELPAAPKILRDVALIACGIKIIGGFYQFGLRPFDAKLPILRYNVENTLRQVSSTLIMLSSTFIWAYPQTSTADADLTHDRRLELGLLILGIIARFVDSIQDTILTYEITYDQGVMGFLQLYFWDYFKREDDNPDSESINAARTDNPRSWLVLAAIATSLGMAAYMHGTFEMEFEGFEHYRDSSAWAITLLVVHLVVILAQLIGTQMENLGFFKYAALSRNIFVRFLVTTTTLVLLTMALSEVGFDGKGDGVSTSPSAAPEDLMVSYKQWNMLGALVSYIAADLVGHVFL